MAVDTDSGGENKNYGHGAPHRSVGFPQRTFGTVGGDAQRYRRIERDLSMRR
jgi:hypothetical protein